MMRSLTLGVVVFVSLGSGALAQTPEPQITAPIAKFMDAFNKGDVAGAAATHAAEADLVILDEVPPFLWRGAKAFQSWVADLTSHDKAAGITGQKVTIGAATRVESDGTTAYVIVPATYTFTQKGAAMRATSQMTFALKKGSSGWLIHGWTWTGARAKRVAAATKH